MGKSKLSNEQKIEVIKLYNSGKYSQRELGRMFNISHTSITMLVNPDFKQKLKEYHKNHWELNKEKLSKQHKNYYENNKTFIKSIHKKYYDENKEKISKWQKEYDSVHRSSFAYVKADEKEQIENYEIALKDNFLGWVIHHRLETHDYDGKIRENEIFPNELKENGLYFNRPAKELIFLKRSEHRHLHNIFLNKRKIKKGKL